MEVRQFDDATYLRSVQAFDNPDHVAIVVHNYRWRVGLAQGEARFDAFEARLAAGPTIAVPTITMEADADGAPHPHAPLRRHLTRAMQSGAKPYGWAAHMIAIDKWPVTLPDAVAPFGPARDEQADARVHGGFDEAVHCHPTLPSQVQILIPMSDRDTASAY